MTEGSAIEARLDLIQGGLEETLTRDELREMLAAGTPLRHYIGFEISGKVHLGTGLMCMSKVKDFMEAGVDVSIFLADWHSWINDKLGGDRDAIREIALGYFAEALKASLECVGGDPDRVNFVLGSELYRDSEDYWATVVEVSKHTSLARMQRSISILGREEGETVDFAKLLYPAMQVADIFVQGITLAHAGMDQRKAHVIARDVARQLTIHPLTTQGHAKIKPVALHHPLVLGLRKPPVWPMPLEKSRELLMAMKMSKSDPKSAVFIHDPPDEIRDKVRRAFCPPGHVDFNPIMDWTKHLVFGAGQRPLLITGRDGGVTEFRDYGELAMAYVREQVHPMDLKNAVADCLIDMLEPARKHFEQPLPRSGLERVQKALTSAVAG